MISVAIKHMSTTGRFLASRAMGAAGGLFKPVRKHYDMRVSYVKSEENGSATATVDALFPSGKYAALDYTPTWAGHRFCGWYASAATPTADAPSSTGSVSPGDPIVYDRAAVYARWQLPTAVTFDATTNGGAMPSGWSAPYYYAGQPYGTLPMPTHPSQSFVKWQDPNGNEATNLSTVPTGGSVLLTAQYGAAVTAFRFLRLHITKRRRATNVMQLSRVDLLTANSSMFSWPSGTTVYDTPNGVNEKGYGNNELPINLVDGSTSTKLCCNGGIGSSQTMDYSAYFDLGAGNTVDVATYTKWRWFTANDSSERDPISFSLEASNDLTTWVMLDSVTNASITTSRKALAYTGTLTLPS